MKYFFLYKKTALFTPLSTHKIGQCSPYDVILRGELQSACCNSNFNFKCGNFPVKENHKSFHFLALLCLWGVAEILSHIFLPLTII